MSTDKVTFSSRLREERERLGLSQSSTSISCGVSREVWGRYENAKTTPGADVLIAFVNLGADASYLLTGIKRLSENFISHGDQGYASDLKVIIDTFIQANDDGRNSLLSLANLINNLQDKTK